MFDKKVGKEVMDSTPVAVPLKFQQQRGMNEVIKGIIESRELANQALKAGKETFEEANDFDVGDDAPDFSSPHEEIYDPVDEEVLNRLTSDEYATKVEARLKQLEAIVAKGKSNGEASRRSDKRGRDVAGKRVSSAGKVDEGKSEPSSKSTDKAGVRAADNGDRESEE